MNLGVCMSQGCIDGRSSCIVLDANGQTCSYDQLLAYQSQTGVKACGPGAPSLPPPPSIPVDVSPNPGTQIVATVPANQLYPSSYAAAGFKIPKWALTLGALAGIGIIVALVVRR
jgi:hypothetical protein